MAVVDIPAATLDEVGAFLGELHGEPVLDLHPLDGGFWSSAFAYRAGDRELVLRLGDVPEGFEMDRAAMAFAGPHLPVPDVVDVGQALGRSYAVSARHHGRFLEDVRPEEAEVAGPALVRTLDAFRAVPAKPGAPAEWYPTEGPAASTWRGWLAEGLVDDPGRRVSGWRATLAGDARLDRLYRVCEDRVAELVEACPERRDLVHGDLLHRNVLVSTDASRVTAVFSWKCSVRGDYLYDVAWCTFWGAWHPGIAAIDLWHRALTAPSLLAGALVVEGALVEDRSDAGALVDAGLRHHCYELQIAATHLGWYAWTGDHEQLRTLATRTDALVERGPLPVPTAAEPSH